MLLVLQAHCSCQRLPRSVLCTTHRWVSVPWSHISWTWCHQSKSCLWLWDKPDLSGHLGRDFCLPTSTYACTGPGWQKYLTSPPVTSQWQPRSAAPKRWPDPASGLSFAQQSFPLCEAPIPIPHRRCSHTLSSRNTLPQQGNKKSISKYFLSSKCRVLRNCSCSCPCVRARS